MLVHICCSVDSHYFLQKVRKDYPEENIVGFFYDPNIHPYSEYYLRLLDVKRSCNILDIPLVEGEYDYELWLDAVRGFEHEPEKGKRCSLCFDRRFEVSAKKAAELGHKTFTSTLLTSPKKSLDQLRQRGNSIAQSYGISFIAPDYRQSSGTQEQNRLAKEAKLYRQDYCGCLYALGQQREQQERFADELSSPVSGQIQPESIEERIKLYEKRIKLEEKNIKYGIVKERFLNWRLIHGRVKSKKHTIPVHIMPYSTLKRNYSRGRIERQIGPLHIFSRDEIKWIDLKSYNQYSEKKYQNIEELIFSPPPFEEELMIRSKFINSPYDLSTLLVSREIPTEKVEVFIDSKCFEDVREKLYISDVQEF